MITLYGIPNCDRVRASRKWLDQHNISYKFHDVRVSGLDRDHVQGWVNQLGMDALVNRRSTTWRQLSPMVRKQLTPSSATELLLAQPTLLKRPVLETDDTLVIGFDEAMYSRVLEVEYV